MNSGNLEFANLYLSAADSARVLATGKENVRSNKSQNISSGDTVSDVPVSSSKKNKRRSNVSAAQAGGGDGSKATSTPFSSKMNRKAGTPAGVESIQRSGSAKKAEKSILRRSVSGEMDDSMIALGLDKPKKRNKSVSFMLEDGEVAVKKVKTTETPNKSRENIPKSENQTENKLRKKKNKKRHERPTVVPTDEANGTEDQKPSEPLMKRRKNKNKNKKSHFTETDETPEQALVDEPNRKKHKRQKIAENIAENLENLTLGDNASTITNLLTNMNVVDKPKKHKKKKNKSQTHLEGSIAAADSDVKESSEPEGSKDIDAISQANEKIHRKKNKKGKRKRTLSEAEVEGEGEAAEAGAERVKWQKRKWNKDRKRASSEDELKATIVVENLPLSMMLTYRKQLSEHFCKYGVVKKIGIMECYPTEEPRPVFTTTVQFDSDEATTQALEEDNMAVCGARVRVRRPLPPAQTTLAVRCYRGCSQQSMSSIFAPCGRVRSIREIVKGSGAIPTAFVEFDGPEAVERALKAAGEARIGGKKVLASRYEERGARRAAAGGGVGAGGGGAGSGPESEQEDSS